MAKASPFSVECKKENNTGIVSISGYIADWNENNAKTVLDAIETATAENDSVRIDIVNCYGGSVFEGLPICRAIADNPKVTGTRLNGVGASMGAVIFAAGKEREVIKSSRLMLHKPSNIAVGQAQELRAAADLLDSVEKDLAEIISSATGKTTNEVTEKWLQPYKDAWVSSSEMIDEGLATKEISGKINKDAPKDVLELKDIGMVAAYYNEQLTQPVIEDTMANDKSILDQVRDLLNIKKKEDTPDPVNVADIEATHKNEIEEITNKSKQIEDSLAAKENELTQVNASLNDMTAKFNDLTAKFDELTAKSAELVKEVEQKEKDIDQVKNILKAHKNTVVIPAENKTFAVPASEAAAEKPAQEKTKEEKKTELKAAREEREKGNKK